MRPADGRLFTRLTDTSQEEAKINSRRKSPAVECRAQTQLDVYILKRVYMHEPKAAHKRVKVCLWTFPLAVEITFSKKHKHTHTRTYTQVCGACSAPLRINKVPSIHQSVPNTSHKVSVADDFNQIGSQL